MVARNSVAHGLCCAQTVLLELMEPYILNDKLTVLSGEVMSDFVDHYQSTNRLQRVEQCILHLDIGMGAHHV